MKKYILCGLLLGIIVQGNQWEWITCTYVIQIENKQTEYENNYLPEKFFPIFTWQPEVL